ncbi:SDR family oxidoreductase [Rhodococcus aerolatus]
MNVSGQKIVVVGGTSGMGRAVAEAAVADGAEVVVVGRDAARAGAVAAELGATGVACDLTDPASIDALAEQVGPLDHLVLSAATLSYGPFLEMDVDEARAVLDGKFWGYYLAVRALAPQLSEQGSITLFSGVAAVRPDSGTTIVTAVNAAIEGLARSLAIELAPRRVNAVSPGVVQTPSWAHLSESERQDTFDQLADSLPVGRVGQPADVAHAVLELASNGYTTGEVRTVDGGARLV